MRIGILLFGHLTLITAAAAQTKRFEYAPMFYHSRTITNSISTLSPDTLDYEPEQGYLKSTLKALNISPESQVLVFSSTSFQKNKITPKTPRAIYFNDSNYVGWIPGADLLEIISIDPFVGPIFYDIEQNAGKPAEVRRNNEDCLDCHSSAKTQSVPGLFIRSSYPKGGGRLVGRTTTHQTELSERWGGWYVTGLTGNVRHRGNQPNGIIEDSDEHLNITNLGSYFDVDKFISPDSDVLSLMVLEHQCHMFNLINRSNYRVRLVMYDHQINPNDPSAELPERVEMEMNRHAPALVRNLLFTSEAELDGPIDGNSGFRTHFESLGPYDELGRSLRQFDGNIRLFKYPCSYMIYTDSFRMLPAAYKMKVYGMLYDILTFDEPSEDYPHLSSVDKKAVYEILKSTVPELSNLWK